MRRRGLFVLIAGPDGIGKTTVADLIEKEVGKRKSVRRVHHRREVLPRRTAHTGDPVVNPHGMRPYPRILSGLKVVYLLADVQLDWLLSAQRHLRNGGWIVAERGWWDMAVDPRRYRLSGVTSLVRLLGRFLPAPDVLIILEAPVGVVLARKAELAGGEIIRQITAWGEVAPKRSRTVRLDATKPPRALAKEAIHEARLLSTTRRLGPWAALPFPRKPRWLIPIRSTRAAKSAFDIYQPVTRKAKFGWKALRVFADGGGLRFFPRATPSIEAIETLAAHVPDGGTVAFSRSRHSDRQIALVIDQRGQPVAVAKIARSAVGAASLEHERHAIATWGSSLPIPIRAPQVIATGDGLLITEFVSSMGVRRPEALPEEIAFAAGRMSAERRSAVGWFAHGDFAPWNLLRAADDWCLIDWENASDEAQPFYDLLHYLVQSATLLGRPRLDTLLAGLRGEGQVGRLVRRYAEGAGLDASTVVDELRNYINMTLPGLDPRFPDDRRGITGRLALLKEIGVAR